MIPFVDFLGISYMNQIYTLQLGKNVKKVVINY
jgi:hypothetical protein